VGVRSVKMSRVSVALLRSQYSLGYNREYSVQYSSMSETYMQRVFYTTGSIAIRVRGYRT